MVEADDGDVVVEIVGVPAAVHLHVGGGDAGAAREQARGTEHQLELAGLVASVPPAVSRGHRARVGQHGGAAHGGGAAGQRDHQTNL